MFYLVWLRLMPWSVLDIEMGFKEKIGGRPFPSTQTLEVDWLKVGIKTKIYLLNVRWLEMERIELFPQK